jgi:hypothetical protein
MRVYEEGKGGFVLLRGARYLSCGDIGQIECEVVVNDCGGVYKGRKFE